MRHLEPGSIRLGTARYKLKDPLTVSRGAKNSRITVKTVTR